MNDQPERLARLEKLAEKAKYGKIDFFMELGRAMGNYEEETFKQEKPCNQKTRDKES